MAGAARLTVELSVVDPSTAHAIRTYETGSKVVGRAEISPLAPLVGSTELSIIAVRFDAGSRFRPHRHDVDQLVCFQYGIGVVALDGADDVIVPAGHLSLLPAQLLHMHGCTTDGPALQLSFMVTRAVHGGTADWDVPYPETWRKWRA